MRTSQGLRLVQGVGRRIELSEPQVSPPAALVGRVVIITRNPEVGASQGAAGHSHVD